MECDVQTEIKQRFNTDIIPMFKKKKKKAILAPNDLVRCNSLSNEVMRVGYESGSAPETTLKDGLLF